MLSVSKQPYTHFNLIYPNSSSLPFIYYSDKRYNEIRRCKLILFSNSLNTNSIHFNNSINNINNKRKIIIKFLLLTGFKKNTAKLIRDYTYAPVYNKLYISEIIERGCLNRSLIKSREYNIRAIWENSKFRDLYHTICYKVSINMDSNSILKSNYINTQIEKKTIVLMLIANLSGKELCPQKYEKLNKKISQRMNQKIKIKYSTLYQCFKCKNNKCVTERVYNRSLDEGVNLRIKCTVCYNEWGG
jgi:DNA-directed RNA polymerase subunit M/transcription elongation factor TFIIS